MNHEFLEYGCGVETHDMFHSGFCHAVLEHLANQTPSNFQGLSAFRG